VWWVTVGWLPGAHQAALSLPLLSPLLCQQWQRCSAAANALVHFQHCSSYKYKAQHYEGNYGEN